MGSRPRRRGRSSSRCWRTGAAGGPPGRGWGDYTESARASFARMVGVPVDWIAIGANTSSMVGPAAAFRTARARVRGAGVHLAPVAVHGAGARNRGRVRAGGRARGFGRRAHRRRRGERGAVVHRRGRRPRRRDRRRRRSRRARGGRRDAGVRLAARRRHAHRPARMQRLQVALLAARNRVHERRPELHDRLTPHARRLVRRRGPARLLLRPALRWRASALAAST